MPVLDGVEATRRIRSAQPETEIVVLTTHADEASILDALRAGARGYLTKDAGHRRDLARGPRRRRPPGGAGPGGPEPRSSRRRARAPGPRRRPQPARRSHPARGRGPLARSAGGSPTARSPRRSWSARRRSRPTSTTCSPRSALATAPRRSTTPTPTGSPDDRLAVSRRSRRGTGRDAAACHRPTGPAPARRFPGRRGLMRQRSGSTWILGPGPAPAGRRPASTSPTCVEPDGGGDERAWIDRARPRRPRPHRAAPASPTGSPTAVTSLSSMCGCRSCSGPREIPM